mmetsp:Transcript_19555/g.34515  ORF Transcript_19555/g.34515 Transcript_19555/m.34515 type:complete len:800 (+) Transcript_19555:42-2441(+)
MCAGTGEHGGRCGGNGYPEALHSQSGVLPLEEEVKALSQHNARLRQQMLSLEQQLREQGKELRQHHEEEMSQRVAKHARDMGAAVTQHEDEMRKVVQRYEQQLSCLADVPAFPRQGRSPASSDGFRSESDWRRTGPLVEGPGVSAAREARMAADAAREAADAEAARYKKKAKQLKAKRGEELRSLRSRIRRAMGVAAGREDSSALRAAFIAWQAFLQQAAAAIDAGAAAEAAEAAIAACTAQKEAPAFSAELLEAAEMGWREEAPSIARLLAAAAGRSQLSALAVLRSWSTAAIQGRHEAELRAQQDKASMQTTSAISMLRNEARALRCKGHRSACRAAELRSRLAMAGPFAAWARQVQARAPAVEPPVPSSSMQRAAVIAVAVRLGASKQRWETLQVLRAWWAVGVEARHANVLRGQLDEATVSQTLALRSLRSELRAFRALGRRIAVQAANRRALQTLLAPFSSWARHVLAGTSSRRLRPGEVLLNSGEAAKRAQQELREVQAQHEAEIAAMRKEVSDARMSASASARREARVDNIARRHELAAKKGEDLAAMLACLKAWIGETILCRSTVALQKEAQERVEESVARARLESRGALRKAWSDAAEASRRASALERRLEDVQQELEGGIPNAVEITRFDGFDNSRPTTALAVEQRLQQAEDRARARISASRGGLVSRGGGQSAAQEEGPSVAPELMGGAEVLRVESEVEEQKLEDRVVEAREGRKGLFIAALAQQAKYCEARAWAGWRRVVLEERCLRLQSARSAQAQSSTPTSLKAMAPSTPRSTGNGTPRRGFREK